MCYSPQLSPQPTWKSMTHRFLQAASTTRLVFSFSNFQPNTSRRTYHGEQDTHLLLDPRWGFFVSRGYRPGNQDQPTQSGHLREEATQPRGNRPRRPQIMSLTLTTPTRRGMTLSLRITKGSPDQTKLMSIFQRVSREKKSTSRSSGPASNTYSF
jgi:hypothetical protein